MLTRQIAFESFPAPVLAPVAPYGLVLIVEVEIPPTLNVTIGREGVMPTLCAIVKTRKQKLR